MKIRTNDDVLVISWKDKGTKGKVLKVFTKTNKVTVEGVNIVTRHMKKQGATPGQKVTYEKPIDASNVSLLDPKTGKKTRVGYTFHEGKKVRFAKQSWNHI